MSAMSSSKSAIPLASLDQCASTKPNKQTFDTNSHPEIQAVPSSIVICAGLSEQQTPIDRNAVSTTKTETIGDTKNRTKIIEDEIEESKNNIVGMICVTISVFLLLSAYAIFSYASIRLKLSLLQCLLVVNAVQHGIAWLLWFLPSSITGKPDHVQKWYGEQDSFQLIWLRGFFYFCDEYFYWTGITLLPLGDAECIYFLCPIFIAFGARLVFKEKFSKPFPIIFLLILIGILIIAQPPWITNLFGADGSQQYFTTEHINLRGLISLIIGCACWALMSLTVRRIPKAHWTQMELTSSLQCSAVWTPLLIALNTALEGTGIDLDNGGTWDFSLYPMMICVAIGALLMLALIFLDVGYQHGEATKVSWLEYTAVPLGYCYQFVLFKESPNIYETVGASIMLSTAFIEVVTESYLYRQAQIKLETQKREQTPGSPSDEVIAV